MLNFNINLFYAIVVGYHAKYVFEMLVGLHGLASMYLQY